MNPQVTIIMVCCVCHRGRIQTGFAPTGFLLDMVGGLEYCPDHYLQTPVVQDIKPTNCEQ